MIKRICKRMATATSLLLVGGCFTGCTSKMADAFFADTTANANERAIKITGVVRAHGLDMQNQHAAMHPEAAEAIDASAAEFAVSAVALQDEIRNIHNTVGSLVARFVGIPDGLPLDAIFKEEASARDTAVAGLKVDAKDMAAAARRADDAGRAAIDKMAATVTADLRERFDNLSAETRDKFASVDRGTFESLQGLKDNDAAFRRELEAKLDLSAAGMEQLAAMSPTEIMALIAAAGAGVAGGRFGPSRSSKAVEAAQRESREAMSVAMAARDATLPK